MLIGYINKKKKNTNIRPQFPWSENLNCNALFTHKGAVFYHQLCEIHNASK